MQYETHRRSILKAISWRTWATITTAVIVFIFTGEFALALTVGLLEVVAKMGLYFLHERVWQRIRFGKREIPSFVLWFTGLPASGKKEIAEKVYGLLKAKYLKTERIDGRDVRPLFPETGFSPDEVNRHIRRAGHLCAMLEKNGIFVVASFVSPFLESRGFARARANNFIEVHVATPVDVCRQRDDKGHYLKAEAGEYKDFPGVHYDYEASAQPEIFIDLSHQSSDEAVEKIMKYLRQHIFKGKI